MSRLTKKVKINTDGVCLGTLKMDDAAEMIYRGYPRKVGKRSAIHAIENALMRLPKENAVLATISAQGRIDWLARQVETFARSEKGNAGKFTPHPATWFNQARYLDDPKEWGAKVLKNGKCEDHPKSGLTDWGTCWEGYAQRARS